jgi:hypothetical protein
MHSSHAHPRSNPGWSTRPIVASKNGLRKTSSDVDRFPPSMPPPKFPSVAFCWRSRNPSIDLLWLPCSSFPSFDGVKFQVSNFRISFAASIYFGRSRMERIPFSKKFSTGDSGPAVPSFRNAATARHLIPFPVEPTARPIFSDGEPLPISIFSISMSLEAGGLTLFGTFNPRLLSMILSSSSCVTS